MGAELIAAVALMLVPGTRVHGLVADVLARDLLGSADGWLARHFVTVTDQFPAGDRTFAIVYLGLHRVVKLALVAGWPGSTASGRGEAPGRCPAAGSRAGHAGGHQRAVLR